ncbi:hypothetical protein CTI12_AA544080 [Artemisia annua]|uniref:Uncharacterized protein n=1 Tax=Artemisia annua TaxID=35608 RepID=A0A2U1L0J9_ARTAN|nr:hypothetical protein CTI12_AA544080 [Artemisia annua]
MTDSNINPNRCGASSFANVLKPERIIRKVNFRSLVNETHIENHDTLLPKAAMEGVLSHVVAPTTSLHNTDDGFKEVLSRKAKAKGKRTAGGFNMGKGPTIAPKKQIYVAKKKNSEASSSGAAVPTSNTFEALNMPSMADNGIPCSSTGVSNAEADVETSIAREIIAEKVVNPLSGDEAHVPLGSDPKKKEPIGAIANIKFSVREGECWVPSSINQAANMILVQVVVRA